MWSLPRELTQQLSLHVAMQQEGFFRPTMSSRANGVSHNSSMVLFQAQRCTWRNQAGAMEKSSRTFLSIPPCPQEQMTNLWCCCMMDMPPTFPSPSLNLPGQTRLSYLFSQRTPLMCSNLWTWFAFPSWNHATTRSVQDSCQMIERIEMDDWKKACWQISFFFKITNKNLTSLFFKNINYFPIASLRLTAPSKLHMNRAKATTKEVLSKYFDELHRIMEKYDLLMNKSKSVYNVDETNINTEHKPPKVANTKAKSKTNAITSQRIATTTLIACGNAAGRVLPPYYVFKGKRRIPQLPDGALPGSKIYMTESGWSNGEVFKDFLVNLFLPSLPRRADGEFVMLLYDGHASHLSVPIIEFVQANQVVLFVLPAHTSHVLQPLDVVCFSATKSCYHSKCARSMQNNPGQVTTRFDVARLSSPAYLWALKVENLRSAFKKSGIYPFDPTAVHIDDVSQTSTLVTPPKGKPSSPPPRDANLLQKKKVFLRMKKGILAWKTAFFICFHRSVHKMILSILRHFAQTHKYWQLEKSTKNCKKGTVGIPVHP